MEQPLDYTLKEPDEHLAMGGRGQITGADAKGKGGLPHPLWDVAAAIG